jgi:large conductance mechanosensitive channel
VAKTNGSSVMPMMVNRPLRLVSLLVLYLVYWLNFFVDDVMMPPIGALISNVDFRDIFIPLSTNTDYPSIQAAKAAGVPTINIGIFLNAVLSFFLVSLALFLVVKAMNKLRRQKDTPTTKTCPECQSSIHIDAKRCPNCTTIFS